MKLFKVGLWIYAALMMVFFGINYYILQYDTQVLAPERIATSTVAIIFGGGMKPTGEESDMQWDRVQVGVSLYKIGKVEKLFMTGDDGRMHSNEVAAMRQQAMDAGVPSTSIQVDPHGYRTYESCYREAHVYGIKEAVVVSQMFHLPRIIYLCSRQGMQVKGISATVRDYGVGAVFMEIRELGARVKAWWQTEVTKPLPLVTN